MKLQACASRWVEKLKRVLDVTRDVTEPSGDYKGKERG